MRSVDEIKKNTRVRVISTAADGMAGYVSLYDTDTTKFTYSFVCSWGGGWEHVSIADLFELPTWKAMQRAKEIFFKDEETCVQYHPAASEYVNNMENCLHIWRPITAKLPTPPSIMVGIKGVRFK